MLSQMLVSQQFEIWVYAKPDFRMPLQCCGLFGSEREACEFGALVRTWLRDRVWSPRFEALFEDDREELWGLLDFISRVMGYDPTTTLVTARKVPHDHPARDNAPMGTPGEHWRLDAGHAPPASPDDDDSDGDDDDSDDHTPLEPPTVMYTTFAEGE